jgi:4-aminobutyrate aminotransferase-like enzyme
MTTSAEIRAKHAEFLFPCVANYYEEPVVLARAKGATATDLDGKEYLDLFGGILTVSLGHCQPDVVEAVSRQVTGWPEVVLARGRVVVDGDRFTGKPGQRRFLRRAPRSI